MLTKNLKRSCCESRYAAICCKIGSSATGGGGHRGKKTCEVPLHQAAVHTQIEKWRRKQPQLTLCEKKKTGKSQRTASAHRNLPMRRDVRKEKYESTQHKKNNLCKHCKPSRRFRKRKRVRSVASPRRLSTSTPA